MHTSHVKIFETSMREEARQIIEMSEKSAVIFDDVKAIIEFQRIKFSQKRVFYRKYYFGSNNVIHRDYLRNENVTFVRKENLQEVVDRVEMYLFGKANIFKGDIMPTKTEEVQVGVKKSFFTLLERCESDWKMLISSHEREDDIGLIIGKDWNSFLEKTLEFAEYTSEIVEENLPEIPYYQIISPHFINGRVEKLSIIHVFKDNDLNEALQKVRMFLKTM